MSSYSYHEIKQFCVDVLVDEFRMQLNKVVFGNLDGKEYIENQTTSK